MSKKGKAGWFILGMLVTMTVTQIALPSMAALTGKMIEVYTGVNIYIDDIKLDPKDANGNPVEAFVYEGTTYLPVRAVGEAVGKTVQWEGKTGSVYLGKHTGEKPAVWLNDLDYFTGRDWDFKSTSKDNLGNTQTNVLVAESKAMDNVYKINGQYSMISGTLYQAYWARSNEGKGTLEIYGDGNLLYSATTNSGIEPIDFSVDLKGVLELRIRFYGAFESWRPDYAEIADCGLWT